MEFWNHADSKQYDHLFKGKDANGLIYQKELCSHLESRLIEKVPCYLTVAGGHLCPVYPFTKMVALERSDLIQWSHL